MELINLSYNSNDNPEKRRHAFIKGHIAIHRLRNKNTVWLDANTKCIMPIDMKTDFRQVYTSSKAIIVGKSNYQHHVIEKFLSDMIQITLHFYEHNKQKYGMDEMLYPDENPDPDENGPEYEKNLTLFKKILNFRQCIVKLISIADTLLSCAGVLCFYGKSFKKILLENKTKEKDLLKQKATSIFDMLKILIFFVKKCCF